MSGRWGTPPDMLNTAIDRLSSIPGTEAVARSRIFRSSGVGPGNPEPFANAVVQVKTHCGPEALLIRLKRLEQDAGPRSAMRWGPRSLDIDIIDYRGRIVGWQGRKNPVWPKTRARLVLPHPLLHERPFVLVPLLDVAPCWRHPVFQQSAQQLWNRIRHRQAGAITGIY